MTATRKLSQDHVAADPHRFAAHLSRGSQLLRANQVLEARAEIEHALRLQPNEPQGQDLLALVYFRSGQYAEAIEIYEALVTEYPNEVSLRMNLSVCYLKTGHPSRACEHLEWVVSQEPDKPRAWGYLGACYVRLGDKKKAKFAFGRAGNAEMVSRVDSLVDDKPFPSLAPQIRTEEPRLTEHPSWREILSMPPRTSGVMGLGDGQRLEGAEVVSEVSSDSLRDFDLGDELLDVGRDSSAPRQSGAWRAVASVGSSPPPGPRAFAAPWSLPPAEPAGLHEAKETLPDWVQAKLLEARDDCRITRREDGLLVVEAALGLSVRMDLVASLVGTKRPVRYSVLQRRGAAGDSSFPVGSMTRPMMSLEGAARVVLCSRTAHYTLQPLSLHKDEVYLREERLALMDASLSYENAAVVTGRGDSMGVVRVFGSGHIVIEAPTSIAALPVEESCDSFVRAVDVIGWLGRLVARKLTPADAPGGELDWLAFQGSGTLLFAVPSQEA